MIPRSVSRFSVIVFGVLMLLSLLAACGPGQLVPTSSPTPAPSPTPASSPTPTPVVPPEGWQLIWHDEFDGDSIDSANWTYDIGGGGWGNSEREYYTSRPENARLENGMLVIEAREEKYKGLSYTSARLKTQGLQTFQYGRVEARLKVPSGQGLWPAFWMLGEDIRKVSWPKCGEIDVMEYIGKEPNSIFGTVHGPGYSGGGGLSKRNDQPYAIADDFHIFAVEWDASQISWFYDGTKYFTVTPTDVGDNKWVFDHPFFIIINLAVGGRWPGPVGEDVVFPAQYLVDYVRVYQEAP